MTASAWTMDPRVRRAIHEDVVCRDLVDAVHDAMESLGATPADLARHLGQSEAHVRAVLTDPLAHPSRDLLNLMTPLGLTMSPTPRTP